MASRRAPGQILYEPPPIVLTELLPTAWAVTEFPLLRNALPLAAPVGVIAKATPDAVAVTAPVLDWLFEMALEGMPAPKVAMVKLLFTELPQATAVVALLPMVDVELSADPVDRSFRANEY